MLPSPFSCFIILPPSKLGSNLTSLETVRCSSKKWKDVTWGSQYEAYNNLFLKQYCLPLRRLKKPQNGETKRHLCAEFWKSNIRLQDSTQPLEICTKLQDIIWDSFCPLHKIPSSSLSVVWLDLLPAHLTCHCVLATLFSGLMSTDLWDRNGTSDRSMGTHSNTPSFQASFQNLLCSVRLHHTVAIMQSSISCGKFPMKPLSVMCFWLAFRYSPPRTILITREDTGASSSWSWGSSPGSSHPPVS